LGRKKLKKEEKKKKITISFNPWFVTILENSGVGYRKFIENLYLNSKK